MKKTLKKFLKNPKHQLPLTLSVIILVTGLAASILLTLTPQDIRQQAATTPPGPTPTPDPVTPPGPNTLPNSIDDDAIMGNLNTATVAIIEFADYQCPFCADFAQNTLPLLKQEYIDSGQVVFVFRDFPQTSFHPQAYVQAEAAECAGDYGNANYYQLHDEIFSRGGNLDYNQLVQLATELGYNTYDFSTCLSNHTHQNEVYFDSQDAIELGANGTPFFLIGSLNPDGTITGENIIGSASYSTFQTVIDKYLDTPTPTPISTTQCTVADFNSDGIVDPLDRNLIISSFFYQTTSDPDTDLNHDGTTDVTDYSIFTNYYSQNCLQ